MADANTARKRSFSKGDLVNALAAQLKASGLKMSKQAIWDLYKLFIDITFELGAKADGGVSLAGIGKAYVLKAKAPEGSGKPFIPRFRFRPSSRLQHALTESFEKGTTLNLIAIPETAGEVADVAVGVADVAVGVAEAVAATAVPESATPREV